MLDYGEYNLCKLAEARIAEIVQGAIAYLRSVLAAPEFTPLSFRAGNWLFQPTSTAAKVLADHGLKVDSSVFKGGVQHQHKLDYRRAARNGYYWKFQDDANAANPSGGLLEIPIYTRMVPIWKMATKKRIGLQRKASSGPRTSWQQLLRLRDFLRFQYPLKFDFCRMTFDELVTVVDAVIREDRKTPSTYKPIVAIGHTKDLVDFETIRVFLSYLKRRGIGVATLEGAYRHSGR